MRDLDAHFILQVNFNPSLAIALIVYPLKTSESFWFSAVFKGYKMGILIRNGLMILIKSNENLLEYNSRGL